MTGFSFQMVNALSHGTVGVLTLVSLMVSRAISISIVLLFALDLENVSAHLICYYFSFVMCCLFLFF